jgi:peptidoglycan/LPS O-acetylase OafA/YrhL
LVYLYHSNQRLLTTEILPASNYGHSSVIVFFVLSGFVIAYITDIKEKEWVSYSASRISRVYSVAVPAVILTIALDAIGRHFYPALYDYPFDNFIVRSASSLLLLNEVWFVSITSFSNVPYWSICYESWYYVAFALLTFCSKRIAYPALVLLVLILGPKVLLLAPIWIAGVILYRWRALNSIPQPVAWTMIFASITGILAFHGGMVSEMAADYLKTLIGAEWHKQLTFSKFFIADYLLGVLVFMNFAGMRAVADTFAPLLLHIERPVRLIAGYTFTLYLLHQPLFLFWAAILRGDPSGYLYWWITTAMVALSVVAIGYVTENKRHILKRWLEKNLARCEQYFARKRHALNI